MVFQVPVYQAVRFMVYDEDQEALRGFYHHQQAIDFIGSDKTLTIKKLPKKFNILEVEEAPF